MRNKRIIGAIATIAAATLVLSGCGGGGTSTYAKGGGSVLTIGMPNGTQTNNSNPFVPTSSGRSLGYTQVIYEPLAQINTLDPTKEATPWLAESWTWNETYTEIEFKIRSGVKWSDGKDLTPADVVYSLNLRKDNEALNAESLPYGSISAEGDTVKVTFDTPQFVNQEKVLNLFVVPEHIWKDIKDPVTDLNQEPVGSGAYTLKSWTA